MSLRFPKHSNGIDLLIKNFSEFLIDSIDYSTENPPPGKNAASGWFWAKMIAPFPEGGEPYLRRNFYIDENLLDEETKTLYKIIKGFVDDFIFGFQKNTNANGRGICFDLIVDGAKSLIPDFIKFIFGDPNASERLNDKAQALFNSYNKECVDSGKHMNGWISVSSQHAALQAISLLDQNGLTGDTTENGQPVRDEVTEAKVLANIFGVTCTSIARLLTIGHDPWMKAQWQLELTMIFESSLAAINSQQNLFWLGRQKDIPTNNKNFMKIFSDKNKV